jgi:hypothetical protein
MGKLLNERFEQLVNSDHGVLNETRVSDKAMEHAIKIITGWITPAHMADRFAKQLRSSAPYKTAEDFNRKLDELFGSNPKMKKKVDFAKQAIVAYPLVENISSNAFLSEAKQLSPNDITEDDLEAWLYQDDSNAPKFDSDRMNQINSLFKGKVEEGEYFDYKEEEKMEKFIRNKAKGRFVYSASPGADGWMLVFSKVKFPKCEDYSNFQSKYS